MEKVGKVEMVKETSDPGFNLGRKIQGNHIVFIFQQVTSFGSIWNPVPFLARVKISLSELNLLFLTYLF